MWWTCNSQRRGRTSSAPGRALWLTACLLVAGACGPREPDSAPAAAGETEQNRRDTFLWRDRLNRPPLAIAVTDLAAPRRAQLLQLLDGMRNRPFAQLRDEMAACIAFGDAAIPLLGERLATEPDAQVRMALVSALSEMGEAAAPHLCLHLRDESTAVALLAVRGLGRLRVPWTLPRLLKEIGLVDAHPELIIRVEAAAAALRFANYAGVPLLLKVLKEHTALQDDRNREWAERVRIAFEKEEALRALVTLSGDDFGYSPNASYDSQADACRRFDGWWSAHRQALWQAARPVADAGLLTVVADLVDGFDVFQIRTVDNARFLLIGLGPPILTPLLEQLGDPRVYVRTHLCEVIHGFGDLLGAADASRAVEALRPLLQDVDAAVRGEATRALGRLDAAPARELLLRALHDRDGSVRVIAIKALGERGGKAALDALTGIAGAADPPDEWAAANAALVRLGQARHLITLLDGLEADAWGTQGAALDALGELGARTASFPLGGDAAARHAARQALEAALTEAEPAH